MFLRIFRLVIKEFLAVWRDPKSRFVLLFPPLLQMFVFGLAATQEIKNVRIGLYDEDRSPASRDLLARFTAARATFSEVRSIESLDEARAALDAQRVLLVVHVGPTFSRDLGARRPAPVQVLLDGRKANSASVVSGYASSIVQQFAAEWPGPGGRVAPRSLPDPASALVTRAWFNPNLTALWSTAPALIGIVTAVVSLLVTALSIARERELGTFEQLLVSPLRPTEILIGKTAPAFLVGLLESTGMLLITRFIFAVPVVGSLVVFYLAIVVYLAAVIGIGLFISSLAKTQQQAILGAFMFMVPAVLLSGFATPVENIPPWLRWVAYGDPLRYILLVIKGTFLEELSLGESLANVWPMVLIAAGTLTAAEWLFRSRLE